MEQLSNAANGLFVWAQTDVVEPEVLYGSVAEDVTIWGLFLQADVIVKSVILILIAASIWSWAIMIDKWLRMRLLRRRARQFEEAFWSGGSLDQLFDRVENAPPDPMSAVFVAAMQEWRRSNPGGSRAAGQGLASTGSAAPFVGLFGTVWGIMNAFTNIASEGNTSLIVVAPGIAEALFATALGLVAAIPATIGYNKLNGDLGNYGQRLEAFSGEFSAIVSRQLEDG